jgi:trypsin
MPDRARVRRSWLAAIIAVISPSAALAIVNGAPASEERFAADYPWAVALVHPESGGVCTAQLISPTWVLTAGHCASDGFRVLTGNVSRTLATSVTVARVIRHPRYDSESGDFDVGLIQLAEPSGVNPVAVISRGEARAMLQPDARAVIVGWGKRSPALPFSDRLIVSDVELRSLTRDKTRFAYFDPVSGPCGGDSGGPLLLTRPDGRRVLAGIASRVVGDLCAQGGGVGIYVNVAEVRDFIEANVKDLPR